MGPAAYSGREAIRSRGLQQFAHRPDVIGDPGFHGRRHAQRLVNADKVVPPPVELASSQFHQLMLPYPSHQRLRLWAQENSAEACGLPWLPWIAVSRFSAAILGRPACVACLAIEAPLAVFQHAIDQTGQPVGQGRDAFGNPQAGAQGFGQRDGSPYECLSPAPSLRRCGCPDDPSREARCASFFHRLMSQARTLIQLAHQD